MVKQGKHRMVAQAQTPTLVPVVKYQRNMPASALAGSRDLSNTLCAVLVAAAAASIAATGESARCDLMMLDSPSVTVCGTWRGRGEGPYWASKTRGAEDMGPLSMGRHGGAGVGAPLMAAGGGAGVVTVWDLEGRRLSTVIRDAHDAPLTSLHFMPGGVSAAWGPLLLRADFGLTACCCWTPLAFSKCVLLGRNEIGEGTAHWKQDGRQSRHCYMAKQGDHTSSL